MPDLGVLNPNPGAQQPLVAPQPAPPSPDSIKLQQALALALMKQGQDTTPIRSPWQGVARVVQSAMGGYQAYQARQEEANARQQAVDAFTKAISGGGQAAPAPNPAPTSPQPAPSGTPMADNTPSAPAQYQPLIAQASQQYGIPQDILTKQLAAESSFNPQAVSPAGAQGIAQFMPGTAKEMGVNALDPNSAIPGAAAYVAQNRDRYGGDMAKALAAYNWGPGNVDKWVAAGANPNALPAETRNYVAKILGPDALNGGNAMAFAPSSGSDNPLAAPPAAKPNPLAAALAQNTTPAAPTSQAGNLGAVLSAMANPYLPAGLASVGSAVLQRTMVPPQYQLMPQADGTVMAVNALNPRDNFVAFKGSAKPIAVQPGATLVVPGQGQPNSAPQQGSGSSSAPAQEGNGFQTVYQNNTGLFNKDTLTSMADQYLAGDKSVLQNLGRTQIGGMNMTALRERIVSRAREMGISPTETASRIGQFDSYTSAQKATGTRGGNVTMAATEAGNLGDLVRQTSANVPRSNYPVWNKVTNAYAENTGDPNIVQFTGALNSYVNAYARAINPTGSTTVSDKEHAREILDTAMSHGQIQAGIDQLQKELDQAKLAPATSSQTIKTEFEKNSNPANSNVLTQARDAIAKGADKNAVVERLRKMGVNPDNL